MKYFSEKLCTSCGVTNLNDDKNKSQWWGLKDYYGFNGLWCSDCYDKISHDSYGRPNNPEEHLLKVLTR